MTSSPEEIRAKLEAGRAVITSPLHAFPSAVLGANEVNTLEMASAYGSLATLGKHAPPLAVLRITDAAGNPIYQADPQPQQVVNAGVAWTTTQILEKVVQQGTGVEAILPRPVAGKTGTAQNWTNAWFVGYIPQMVAAVWVGFPQGQISMTAPRVRLPHVLGSLAGRHDADPPLCRLHQDPVDVVRPHDLAPGLRLGGGIGQCESPSPTGVGHRLWRHKHSRDGKSVAGLHPEQPHLLSAV